MNNMGPAHSPDIPASEGVSLTQFQEEQTGRMLLVIVALWEKLDTPQKCVNAAFQAFLSELALRLGHRIGALKLAYEANNQDEVNLLIKEIEGYVRTAIKSAIESNLSAWESKNRCRLDAS